MTRRADEIAEKAVSWIWDGRIPRGELTVIAGHPASGKSTLAASLAAHVTSGNPFPDGSQPSSGEVLLLSAEEAADKAIVPRLRIAGAILSRVRIADIRLRLDDRTRIFSLAGGTGPIEDALDSLHDPALVILDSLTSCTGGIDTYRTDAFGPILADLQQTAERRNVAVLALAHFTKAFNSRALLRVLGSVAIVALARAVFVLLTHPDDETRRILTPVKNTYAPLGTPIECRLITSQDGLPSFRFTDSVPAIDADTVMSLEAPDRRLERRDAIEFLHSELDGEERKKADELYKDASDRGISKTTLWRAARELGVVFEGKGRASTWRQPIIPESFQPHVPEAETIPETIREREV